MHLILDIYVEEVVRTEIENKIKDEYTALWDGGGKLFELQDWGMVVGQFLEKFAFTHLVPKSKVPIIIKESYAISRAEELFDMIRDYPESRDSLREFKDCMAQMATEKRAKIIQNLLRSIKLRLLHPGAFTELIIEFYLMAAQALYCLGTDFARFLLKNLAAHYIQPQTHQVLTCRLFASRYVTTFEHEPTQPRYFLSFSGHYMLGILDSYETV